MRGFLPGIVETSLNILQFCLPPFAALAVLIKLQLSQLENESERQDWKLCVHLVIKILCKMLATKINLR